MYTGWTATKALQQQRPVVVHRRGVNGSICTPRLWFFRRDYRHYYYYALLLVLGLRNIAFGWVTQRATFCRRNNNHPSYHLYSTTTSTPTTTKTTLREVLLTELLSTCIDACILGCKEIQKVQYQRERTGTLQQQVKRKDVLDPKSALTEADTNAQRVIVQSLRQEWQKSHHLLLQIIGEEDDDNDDENENETDDSTQFQLKRDWCTHLRRPESSMTSSPQQDLVVSFEDVIIYVDPLDGTREFVEERLQNCQTLIGISVNGTAVAGAIGIPFPYGSAALNENSTTTATTTTTNSTVVVVVYGCVGMGYGTVFVETTTTTGTTSTTTSTTGRQQRVVPSSNPQYAATPRPRIATGDSMAAVMVESRNIAVQLLQQEQQPQETHPSGGTCLLYGGAGNKILATAIGDVDATIQHCYGGLWDICAPAAIVRSMGGRITNLCGEDVMTGMDIGGVDDANLGFVATGMTSCLHHDDLIQALRKSPVVQAYVNKARAVRESQSP